MLSSLLILGLAMGFGEGRRPNIPTVTPNAGWEEFGTRNCEGTILRTRVESPSAKLSIRGVAPCGYRYAVFVDDAFLGKTSNPECHLNNRQDDVLTFGEYEIGSGRHKIEVVPIQETRRNSKRSVFEVRVDTQTICAPKDDAPIVADDDVVIPDVEDDVEDESKALPETTIPMKPTVCPPVPPKPPVVGGEFAVINQRVPRCQAVEVCKANGMHLANINTGNFMTATKAVFKDLGANAQVWIDDWNGDQYVGTCIVLTTGADASAASVNVPECCSAPLPVLCQKTPNTNPVVEYSCNSCQEATICSKSSLKECVNCEFGVCMPSKNCERCLFADL